MQHTLHVVALPHTQTNPSHGQCAYTTKVFRFCRMMSDLGHHVVHYGNEGSSAQCSEDVVLFSKEEQDRAFESFDWYERGELYKIPWHDHLPPWRAFNERAVEELRRRVQPRDFLCIIGGRAQQCIADAFPAMIATEYGIGYEGVFSKYRVFESYAWMHHVYGLIQQKDGGFYDAVIPNFFDPADFPFEEQKDDYFLFMSRMTPRKGYDIAVELTRRIGAKLIIAGRGGDRVDAPHVEHVGFADVPTRGRLMSRARAVLVPTQYIEPFGGVAVEANFCGTPVITTDWGAFAETVCHGTTGFRCRTLEQFMWAANHVHVIRPETCRQWAVENYSTKRVGRMYEEYFAMLSTLWQRGWYEDNETRDELDWLRRLPTSGVAGLPDLAGSSSAG